MYVPNWIVDVAWIVVMIAGLWLVFAGLVALFRPAVAIRFIARMGSTVRIHWTEHSIRGLVGLALMLAAEASRAPQLFLGGGSFVLATSALILFAPREWHASYARSASSKLNPTLLRLLAPLSIGGGAGLIWAI